MAYVYYHNNLEAQSLPSTYLKKVIDVRLKDDDRQLVLIFNVIEILSRYLRKVILREKRLKIKII